MKKNIILLLMAFYLLPFNTFSQDTSGTQEALPDTLQDGERYTPQGTQSQSRSQEVPQEVPQVNPKDPENSVTYKVIQGDTLYSVARKFNVNIEDLKKENKLTSDSVDLGRVLKIPGNPYATPLSNIAIETALSSAIEEGTYFPYYTIKLDTNGNIIKDSKKLPGYTIRVKIDKNSNRIQFSFFENNKKINDEIFPFNKSDIYVIADKSSSDSSDRIRVKNFPTSNILVEFFSDSGTYLGGVVLLRSKSS